MFADISKEIPDSVGLRRRDIPNFSSKFEVFPRQAEKGLLSSGQGNLQLHNRVPYLLGRLSVSENPRVNSGELRGSGKTYSASSEHNYVLQVLKLFGNELGHSRESTHGCSHRRTVALSIRVSFPT
jgi:hypothetical protein